MLNSKQERELAYVVIVSGIEELPGYDRVESALIGGWRCIVPKGQFKVGDPGIYFEIDSKVPADNPVFAFMEKRHYKVKTLRMCKSLSQGLLMHAEDFSWTIGEDEDENIYICDDKGKRHYAADDLEDTMFLTKELGVTYADAEDNQRKAPSIDKYKKMAQRNPTIFKKPFVRWLMKRQWGKDLLFIFFGKSKDKKNGWPAWVQKTDEERIQNMPWILKDDGEWIVTEKIDGTSTTFTMRRGKRGKKEFYVCSRNVCFDSVDKPCYYETNVYWEMAQKYDMYNVLSDLLDIYPCDWITVQGETYGPGVQRRDYSKDGHDFCAFNLIMSDRGRLNTIEMSELLNEFNIPCVPIIDEHFKFENRDVDALLEYAEGNSVLDGKPREGFVFRDKDGVRSFKAVSNVYLLKYHQ